MELPCQHCIGAPNCQRPGATFRYCSHWTGPEHDRYMALYKQAMVTREAAKRKDIYAQMQAILFEEVPAVLPAGGNTFLIKRKNIRDMAYHPQIWSIRFDKVWKA